MLFICGCEKVVCGVFDDFGYEGGVVVYDVLFGIVLELCVGVDSGCGCGCCYDLMVVGIVCCVDFGLWWCCLVLFGGVWFCLVLEMI